MTARRYQVRGLLGEGAFGAVYLAEPVGGGLQRTVAIKVLHAERAASPDIVGRLRDEARMLSLIRHRAIVRVDDLVELDGSWSIVMEYVEGADLGALLRRGPLPPGVALAVGEEVANALNAAWHQAGPDGQPLRLVHRDIKPGNLRLTSLGEVKLLDFGVARAEFAEREADTTRAAFGTLVYMAPERFDGKDGHAADVYALGVTLFELLTAASPGRLASDPGRQPPGGQVARQWAFLASLSPDLHALIAQMLAYDPAMRPSSRACARTLGDLRVLFREERIEDWAARTVPAVMAEGKPPLRADARTGSLLVEGPLPAAVPPPVEAPSRWRRVALGLGAAGLLGLVVVGGAFAWSLRPLPAPAPVVASPPSTPLATALADEARVAPVAARPPAQGSAPAPAGASAAKGRPPTPRPSGQTAAQTGAGTGAVRLTGDPVRVTFVGEPGRFADPAALPPGTYDALVAFPAGEEVTIRGVSVRAGSVTTFTCSAAFANCSATHD